MKKFRRYGKWWYPDKREIYADRKPHEDIFYDSGLKAYCITQSHSIWDF